MPAIEKLRVKLDTAAIFFDGAFQLTNGEIAVCVIKDVINRLFH